MGPTHLLQAAISRAKAGITFLSSLSAQFTKLASKELPRTDHARAILLEPTATSEGASPLEQTRPDPVVTNDKYTLSDLDMISPNSLVAFYLIYKLEATHDIHIVTETLQQGLKRAAEQLLLLAAKIRFDSSGKPLKRMVPGSLEAKICTFESWEHKSYDQLAAASFPPDDFDQAQLIPVEIYDNTDERPVLLVQLNFIPGGLIFGLGFNHVANDGVSMNLALTLISKCSKAYMERTSELRSSFDYQRAAFAANPAALALPKEQLSAHVRDYRIVEITGTLNDRNVPKPTRALRGVKGLIYRIEGEAVQRLKDSCSPLGGTEYISTYDCIVGMLWRSVVRVRTELNPHLKTSNSRLLHPVDLRHRPESGISEKYLGNAVAVANAGPVQVVDLLGTKGLSLAASSVRHSIENTTLASIGDAIALGTKMASTENLIFKPGGGLQEANFMLTTWYFMNTAAYDFGIGPPESVRCSPVLTAGFMLLFPDCRRQKDSRVYDLYITLSEAEHRLLKEDEEFRSWFSILQ
ncbi:transferase family-domain-containing protein [Hypoxylon fuscum]|nr:transferase family-domain-containing protein [Hypoxylon fuscum]